ncbi:MAG: ABC transporter permease subunit [Planctomycetaceae bacterium]|nr:ABC transporter permease subunit [Planctomycetaceae bacterium]
MPQTATFTGRSRRRQTHPWVRAGDAVARAVITLGGIGTIVAVLLVGVYLLAVALPLFRPARSSRMGTDLVHADPLHMGVDESGSVAWVLDGGDGVAGAERVNVLATATGDRLLSVPTRDCGLEGWSALRTEPGGLAAAVGFADGTFRTGRFGLQAEFMAAADAPAAVRSTPVGHAVAADGIVFVHGANDRFARVRLVTELGPASQPLAGPITEVDVVPLGDGALVAALDDAGRVRVERAASKRNMLTGKVTVKTTGATIEPVAGFRPRFLRVNGLGDQLFLFAADGSARRYVIRDATKPELMETFDAAAGAADVATVERLFGGATLAVADTAGVVRLFFMARQDDAVAADGLTTVAARTITGNGTRVDAIAASPRSRLFAVAESRAGLDAGVRLLQATTGAEVLRLAAGGGGTHPTRTMCIAPRENRLLAGNDEAIAAWAIDAGHADVAVGTLLRPVWYENYPRPVHAWETTGHEAFESKFGLVPLIFGTLKASVVLGFVAGIVLAPVIERGLMPVITGVFVVPLTLLAAAHLWQLLPVGTRSRLAAWRFPLVAVVALPIGLLAARAAAPAVERILFDGDVQAWLDGRGGRGGRGFGGWMVALLPLAAVAAAALVGRLVNPLLRRAARAWSQPQAALASLGVFAAGLVVAVALAAAAAVLLDALRLDTRGGLFGTYVQRNALVVAIGMSFAIIPLIFTIADDALSSVPEHLRSASLGAGATPWQTAVRVIVPAAASGLFSAVMIGLGRAVGETMIVLMAAGNTPLIGWNVFNGFQTLSAAIATELPEAARGSTHYRVLFLAALALFALTFVLNTVAELVRQRFRRRAHDL